MTKKVGRRSSGLFRRGSGGAPQPARPMTPEEMHSFMLDLQKAFSPEGRREEFERGLAMMEKEAMWIYAYYGLPTEAGAYQRVDGRWLLVGSPRESSLGRTYSLSQIGREYPADSEIRYGVRLLEMSAEAREELANEDHHVGFIKGFNLALEAMIWHLDWDQGERIRRGESSILGQRKSAENNDWKHEEAQRRHAKAQQRADQIWDDQPTASKARVARKIEDERIVYPLTADTIRKIIKR